MPANRLLSVNVALAVALILGGGMLAYAIHGETPMGGLKGAVTAQESGNLLDAWVGLESRPHKDGKVESYDRHAYDGSFSFKSIPTGEYTMTVSTEHRQSPPIKVTIEEGKTADMNVELAPGKPFIDLYIHQHIFTPDEKPQITCKGYLESSAVQMRVYKVDLDAFLIKSSGSLQRLLGVYSYSSDSYSRANLNTNAALTPTDSFRQNITRRESDGCFTQRIDLSKMQPGLYVVSARGDDVQQLGWVMVTSLGLVTKTASPEVLGYVVDLKSGAPVAGADVKVYAESAAVASGATGADGLVSLKLPASEGGSTERTIVARSGESFAFVSAYMSSSDSTGTSIYAYTDRPVYRPGQKVYFRGVARKFTGDNYEVLASKQVTVEVRDPRDTLIYRGTKTTDRFGCYHGELDLNPETATGTYSLVSTVGGQPAAEVDDEGGDEGITFQVKAYSKPEFSVKVEFAKKRYVRNDRVKARIVASYYFGAPVANAKVNYTVRRSGYWLFGEDQEDFYGEGGYEDYGGYGEMVQEEEVTTDENGVAEVTFPAEWPEPEEEDGWDSDQEFSIEAYVTDSSRREASGEGSVVATRGEFAIDATPESYVARPGQTVTVNIEAQDYDRKPVRNQEVDATIGRDYWTGSESKLDKWEERKVTTDRFGRASLTFKPKRGGSVRVTLSARDKRGNRIVTSAYVWCYSEASDDYGDTHYGELQVITDKRTYKPGDTAKVLINTSKPGATALVTVEGPRIYDRFTVPLKKRSTAVDIAVRPEYRPNFYIDVCYVRNKSFTSQEARAKVSLGPQSLSVKIQPNKQRYLPGEKATYKLTTKTADGKPVSAELSLGVVDEAIYAIAEDRTPKPLDYFYFRKPNEVGTRFSFPEIYLSDSDKAGDSSKMPRRALDDVYKRKRFLDTAYWNPDIITNAKGEATVSFDFPDNLTTWRATVRAITLDTRCGEARDAVLAQQDLLVRLESPRFLVQGDTTTISAIVHNYTGERQKVDVSFGARGLKANGAHRRDIRVDNNGSERIDWTVTATKPGDFPISVFARAAKTGDAMMLTLPVLPHGEERTTTRTGELGNKPSVTLHVPVRNDSIPEATRMTLRLAPSLASALFGSLDYLAQYPYGCTEQTTSSFLPDVILARTLKNLGISNPSLERKLPDMVSKGLFRLYRFQLEDGGWSWCEYGKADPWMTAYVCYGLIQARNAGFPVNTDILSRGISSLRQLAGREKLDTYTRAYAYYVLALAGDDTGDELASIAQQRGLGSGTLAVLALGLSQAGHVEQAKWVMGRLYDRAVREPGMIHWTNSNDYWYGDVEPTAMALQAALRVNRGDPRIYDIVRWLMHERQGNYWYSTRDTAMTLYAMCDFLEGTSELTPDYDAEVYVNGKRVTSAHFDKESIFQPDRAVVIDSRDLRKGRNEIEIRKSGEGSLYYTASLKQYLAMDSIPATVTGGGVTVSRVYYKPGPRYDETGRDSDLGSPVDACDSGDVILVKLTTHATRRLEHLLLEDYIPAGFEIVDKGHVDYWDWDYWYVGRDIRDEKVSFYLDSVSPGKHVVTYRTRAWLPGKYHAMPAQVFGMYDPRVRATTAEAPFEVRQ